ncbi:MAG: monomethylamine:corrinoid methyltransferase [Anaerolineae bacterium]
MVSFSEVAKRAETGELMPSEDFNMKLVASKAMELQAKYDLRFDAEQLVNTDDDLADRAWQAGLELFLHTGLYSVNSRRVIKFSEDEVKETLYYAPSQLVAGEGKDAVTLYHRDVEDPRPPLLFGGPFNADVDEATFVRLNEAFARERIIDLLFLPGHLKTLDGLDLRPNSGLSTRAIISYGMWSREAIRRAGRPGMPIVGHSLMALNEIACTNEGWGLRRTDPRAGAILSELQVDDVLLTRLAYYIDYGCPIYISSTPLVGGFGGGPEGTAIVGVASHMGAVMLGSDIMHLGPQHIKFKQQTNMHSLWVGSVVNQAVARNSHLIATTSHTTSGRTGSMQYIYEFTALALASVTGGSHLTGPRPANPLFFNHVSPLMGRLFGEVGRAAARLKRAEANQMVKALYERYKDKILFDQAPQGKPFEQLYDLDTLTPTPEHMGQYEKGKEELRELGLDL